jgi:DNA-binding NtrC family response regulator
MCAKILVVDDEIAMRKLLYDLLDDEIYDVELAENATEALEKIKVTDFDLIISDIKMPNMSGLELMYKIKELEIDSAVIFITGYGSIDDAVEAIKLGVSDYIEKPFQVKQFRALVSKVLRERSLRLAIIEDKLLVHTMNRAILSNNQTLTVRKY